ncbi:MATE family efflux transporter [Porcincola intestinalis]|uniref:MATE family efflux transporter n=1 Tax=Porcincola intestinalis TaxID=2606632 RepID=UPI0023F343A8|nr:MATE family efflux transporter [Porcincola intestinalis]MCI6767081.1 MATE family efflux transporter [Lachnospiraceae bacterium]MDD7059273.1 MATE family efflux transporter [Porcincola intestinalis]MDY4203815.1 MATE family efflux transporter [Porcincola intestinalis]MDY5284207.1 MATE family efflux transporter [Porcincola intestinalis]MDY5580307.1 MATE family efflux transporter [Porcincola intestinalis]
MQNQHEDQTRQQYIRMTQTPIGKLIGTLAIPTIISMLVTNIYNTADTYFVSRLGTSASGAVGIVFAFMTFYQAIGFMCGHGAGSFVARFLGAKSPDKAKMFAASTFFLSSLLGTLLSLAFYLNLNRVLYFLGSTETILPYARQYAVWILIAGPFLSASCTLNNLLRYEGRAMYAMIGLTTGGILNMIGDPILMFGFGMGVSGAGLSTCLSQIISFLILLSMFCIHITVTDVSPRRISTELSTYWEIMKVGSPSLLRQGLNAASTILLNQQAKVYGDPAIAAMSIVGRMSFFIGACAIGTGQGMQPVISFNYGARKYKRVRESFHFTVKMAAALLSVFAVVCMIFARPIITWFRDDPEVIEIGTVALRWACVSALFQPLSVPINMMFQSIGKSGRALFLSALRTGLCFIPLIEILPLYLGLTGIEIAQPVSDITAALISVPFAVSFLRQLKARKEPGEIQAAPVPEKKEC